MAKVLGVGASPRKGGNTDILLRKALAGAAAAGAAAEEIQLRDYAIQPCVGCENCRKAGRCTRLMDGMQCLYPKINESRGLIMASPTHNYNITAWMKAFIDRLYPYYCFTDDRPRRYTSRFEGQGRQVALIAVCEQTDPEEMGFTLEAMSRPMTALGFSICGQVPVFGVFEAGAVNRYPQALTEAESLGQKLGHRLE